MTATVLVSGRLLRDPEAKKSAAKSTEYVSATLRVGQGNDIVWWRVSAFGPEVRSELAAMRAGDTVAVTGPVRAEAYLKDGQPKVSLSVIADRIISAKRPRKHKERSVGHNAESWQAPLAERPAIAAHANVCPFE